MNQSDLFEAIVSEHYQPLFRFALSLTRSGSDAMDLTQHTFYTWAKCGHQLRDHSKVKSWLYTTLHRAFLRSRRRESRFPHSELEEVSHQLPVLSPESTERMDSGHLLSALRRVDEVFQGAVALFYLEDYSYSEISAILEVPVGTVKSRIGRGLAQLRRILSPTAFGMPSRARETLANSCPREREVRPPTGSFGPSVSGNEPGVTGSQR